MERFSHNSRRTDQYRGRVADIAAGAIPCEPKDSGIALDSVFIWLLLVPDGLYWPAYLPSYFPTRQRTSRRCWACAHRLMWQVAGDRHDRALDRALDRRAGCCGRAPGARASA